MDGNVYWKEEHVAAPSSINFNYSEGRLKLIYNNTNVNGDFPTGYCGGLSAISKYSGFQIVAYGGNNDRIFIRKTVDNNTWRPWGRLLTNLDYTDTLNNTYVLKTGDTMTGRLTAPDVFATTLWATSTLRSNLLLTVGTSGAIVNSNRVELHLVTPSDNPCDLWLGVGSAKRWSITARSSGEGYKLGIYNNILSQYNVLFSDINDFRQKTQINGGFLINPESGSFNEGIRISNAPSGWSNIHFGTANAWSGKQSNQWLVGKNPVGYLQVCVAGTETSTTTRPSKGFSVDTNGYLHTGYISVEINTDNQGDYFYASDDAFLRRTAWHTALSHLNQKTLTLNLSGLDQNKWYPCSIGAPAYRGTPLRITFFNGLQGNKPSWGTHISGFSLLLDYYVIGSGWGTLASVSKLDWYWGSYGGETAFGGRQQNTMGTTEIVYLRGGGVYYYRTTNGATFTINQNGYSWANGSYTYNAPVKTSQDNSPIEKTFDQVYWAPNNLRETRTFWGQPFNGTQNVSGSLSGVTTIDASSTIYTGGDLYAYNNVKAGGKMIIDCNRYSPGATPSISLAIGDTDTGFNWDHDGYINIVSNAVNAGYWGRAEARFHNAYFRIASGNDYHTLGIMVNGNGTANTVKPGIGFHQPGVYANSLRSDGPGNFKFCVQGGSVGCTVEAANFYANGGFLYSNANGCEVRIGSQNTGFVHITNNANRSYYFDKMITTNGNILPYTTSNFDLGDASHRWRIIYLADSYASGWYRSQGQTGWYSNDYGGGIYMTDTTYVRVYNNKSFYVSGNILATGGITAKSTSDIRLKIKINNPMSYKDRLMNLGMVFDYRFNSIAKSRIGKLTDDLNHIGLSYQSVKQILPTITGEDEDKYGYINYISPDLISLSIGAIQEVILEERKIKEDIIILKSKVERLESENIILKKRLGLIA